MSTLGKALLVFSLILPALFLTGCATPVPAGLIYTKITSPVSTAGGDLKYSKIGEAKAHSLFGLFANGDSSLQAACRNGGLRNAKYINYKVDNFCGIWGSYTTVVYGD